MVFLWFINLFCKTRLHQKRHIKLLLGKVAKEYEKNWEGVELMKTEEKIYQRIKELENDITEFKNIINNKI